MASQIARRVLERNPCGARRFFSSESNLIRATLFPGDGIGPEIAESVKQIFKTAEVPIEWEEHYVGKEIDPRTNSFLTWESLESVRRNKVGLKGPMATPIGKGHRSLNLTLRKELNLYANVRPCYSLPGYKTRYDNVNLITIRENTEGEYSGLEHQVVRGVVESLKIITRQASLRVAEYTFHYAKAHGRERVSAIHKANIMQKTDGLFLKCWELTIQRVKVTTTPDDRVLDIFFITDNLELLHTKERQNETYKQLYDVLGQSCSCELQLAGPQYDHLHSISSLSPSVSEELFRCELSDNEFRTQALSLDMTQLRKASVTIDNSLSPGHTLLQIGCVDHKGFLYDIMRTLKDCNIQISYGRFSPVNKGQRELDLFIRQKDGKKIVDPDKRDALCSRLKVEMLHPLRVIITNRGPDTELLVANPVELSGKGRPRVFYDVTLALKTLGICIFSAEIGRHCTSDREWEFYRFLLDENCRFDLSCMAGRNQIVDRVRRTLMGW